MDWPSSRRAAGVRLGVRSSTGWNLRPPADHSMAWPSGNAEPDDVELLLAGVEPAQRLPELVERCVAVEPGLGGRQLLDARRFDLLDRQRRERRVIAAHRLHGVAGLVAGSCPPHREALAAAEDGLDPLLAEVEWLWHAASLGAAPRPGNPAC